MNTKPIKDFDQIPTEWLRYRLPALILVANRYAWNYIQLAELPISEAEYNTRASELDVRACWLENRITELTAKERI